MIALTVNGKRHEIDAPLDLPSFLTELGVANLHIAVAHNGDVIRKDEYASVTLKDGDTLEIVRAVGGGAR